MKKLISILLLASMLIGCVSFSVIGDENALPFVDVKNDSWYYDAVAYSFENGIFKGTNNDGTEFSPNRAMTRAEFATTLFRISGANADAYAGDTGFTDVPAGQWMSAAVKWAAERGYVKGTGANKFDPNGTLDRQQLATMLYRFVSATFDTSAVDADVLSNFDDAEKVASWANEAMTWTASVKVLNGNDKNMVLPEAYATRAQVAQILMNFEMLYAGSGSEGMIDADLVFSMNNTKYTEAKNIIYMIGDGMGFNIIEMTEHYYSDELYNGTLAMNYIPQQSCHTSYSQSHSVTDSAAGGTALSTGRKTENDVVGMDPSGDEVYTNVLELAAQKGMSTGIIATKSVTDATPAAFSAHTPARQYQGDIAEQQMEMVKEGSLDIVLGGGIVYYNDEQTADVLNAAVANGEFNYTESFEEAIEMDLPLIALFDDEAMDTYNEDLPTLAEMTTLALDRLSADENGFFLMVEGSQIDTFNHSNKLEEAMHETYHFDLAIAVVLNFIKNNPDTVLIITADHETGGLVIPEELDDDTFGDYIYLHGSHTSRNVPVYALGYGVEELNKVNENTDVAIFVASLLGVDDFGSKSENLNIISKDNNDNKNALVAENPASEVLENGVSILIDDDNPEFNFDISAFNTKTSDIKNARVIHIEFTNITDSYVCLPSMYVNLEYVDPHLEYLNPGESAIVSYVLPSTVWKDNVFATITSLGLYLEEPYFDYDSDVVSLVMGDVCVTNRDLKD